MDAMYSLMQIGFNIDDSTESKDFLYWHSAYLKDKEKSRQAEKKARAQQARRRIW